MSEAYNNICFPNDTRVVPSVQHSDNLYHFNRKPTRLLNALKSGGFTLNYVEEDFSFLGLSQIQKVAFPMMCFCDIVSDERIKPHMSNYGHWGIGLSKAWGKRAGIQPVHYLIPESPFFRDLITALDIALNIDEAEITPEMEILSDFLVTTLAYSKPTYGTMNNKLYCFEDECEWRYIPSNLPDGLETILVNPNNDLLTNHRGTIWFAKTCLLRFEYADITDIFVPDDPSVTTMTEAINALPIDSRNKERLRNSVRNSQCLDRFEA